MDREFTLKPMLKSYRYALGSIAGAAVLTGIAAALTIVVLKRLQKQAEVADAETPETLEVVDESEAPCCCAPAADACCCAETAETEEPCCCDAAPAGAEA